MIAADALTGKLMELRALRDKRAELDVERKKMTEELEKRNAELVEYFEHNDLQQMRLEGAGLFYVARTSFPEIEDKQAVQEWLEAKGDLDLIMTFNTSKFRAYFNEKVENNDDLPPKCNQFIKTEIRMRRN